jgi:hypothetical protein
MGDEWTHSAHFGDRQRLAVFGLAALGVEPVGVCSDVAEQIQPVCGGSGLGRKQFGRTLTQTVRLVEAPEQETGASQGVVVPAANLDPSLRRKTFGGLLTFPEADQRFA